VLADQFEKRGIFQRARSRHGTRDHRRRQGCRDDAKARHETSRST
jgi:hypothetical protein